LENHGSYNPMILSESHYLITGAASGIGRAVSILLDKLGARLSLVDINAKGLVETKSLCSNANHSIWEFNLKNIEKINELVKNIVEADGQLNGMIHAAGIQSVAPVKVLSIDVWREIFAINTEAGLELAKYLQSKKVYAGTNGAIVFISSIMGLVGSPGAVAYSMSKSALHGIARSMALEYSSKGIRVNCIAPGFVHTPLYDKTARLWDEEQRKKVEAMHPLGIGQPEDVANAVAFLVSNMGRWVTGSVLSVDGGYCAQ